MPARRRPRTHQQIKKPFPRKTKILLSVITFILVVLGIIFWFITSRAINTSKLTVVFAQDDGNAQVAVFDFDLKELTTINIPQNTYLESAYGFGDWKVGSLRKLGEQEEYGGELLRMSLVKNFHFPIDAWISGDIPGNGIFESFKLVSKDSSLSIREKLQLASFILRTPGQNRYAIDLVESRNLKKAVLPDGTEGYSPSEDLPPQVGTIFTIPQEDGFFRVGIYDYTGGRVTPIKNLSEVIHIMGGDWAVIENDAQELDCLVRGEKSHLVNRISEVLNCKIDSSKIEGNFDIEVLVGIKFIERF